VHLSKRPGRKHELGIEHQGRVTHSRRHLFDEDMRERWPIAFTDADIGLGCDDRCGGDNDRTDQPALCLTLNRLEARIQVRGRVPMDHEERDG
jgi:hypothetical protein